MGAQIARGMLTRIGAKMIPGVPQHLPKANAAGTMIKISATELYS